MTSSYQMFKCVINYCYTLTKKWVLIHAMFDNATFNKLLEIPSQQNEKALSCPVFMQDVKWHTWCHCEVAHLMSLSYCALSPLSVIIAASPADLPQNKTITWWGESLHGSKLTRLLEPQSAPLCREEKIQQQMQISASELVTSSMTTLPHTGTRWVVISLTLLMNSCTIGVLCLLHCCWGYTVRHIHCVYSH